MLLTNRVNPTRSNEKIRQVRPALHDAIFQALGLANAVHFCSITSSAHSLREFVQAPYWNSPIAIIKGRLFAGRWTAEGALKPTRTEQRNPRSRGLDPKSTIEILRVLNREDARVALAVRRELPQIARAVDAIVASFRTGRQALLRRRGNQRPAGGS